MYLQYFGLKEKPFSIAPNPRYLYMSRLHQDALAHLIYGLQGEGGIILLTGEVGTGKTTISRKLLEDVPANTEIAWIINPKLSVEELLAAICDELSIDYVQGQVSIKQFTDLISASLIEAHGQGRNTVLMIDEAQNLSPEVLEQLRLLTNLETNERKLLQIILLGQPELKTMLDRQDLRQLAQRITARYHLNSLSRFETGEYIRHRLAVAGCDRLVFPARSINHIHHLSRGIPRLINLLCGRALLGVYAQGGSTARPEHIQQAASEVLPEDNKAKHPKNNTLSLIILALAVTVLAAVLVINDFIHVQPVQTYLSNTAELTAAGSGEADTAVSPPEKTEKSAAVPPNDNAPDKSDPWMEIADQGSETLAYQTMADLWKVALPSLGKVAPCEQFASLGLQCLRQRGGIGKLRSLNRPAVIQFSINDASDAYAALTAIDMDSATLQLGSRQWRISLAEFEQRWYEDFTILWRSPPGFDGLIRPGSEGEAVEWLVNELDQVQGELIPAQDTYRMNPLLIERLMDFQRSAGIEPDGAAGAQTLIRLNDAVGSEGPRLYFREPG